MVQTLSSRFGGWLLGVLATVVAGVLLAAVLAVANQGPARFRGGDPVEVEFLNVDEDSGIGAMALGHRLGTSDHVALLRGEAGQGNWPAYLAAHRGAYVEAMHLQVGLKGRGPGRIRIRDIRPRILSTEPVLTAVYLSNPPQGVQPAIKLTASLDRRPPAFEVSPGRPYRSSLNIDLDPGERQTLALKVTASRQTYSWDIELDIVGHPPIYIQRPGNRPFVVTGHTTRPSAYRDVYVSNDSVEGFHLATSKERCRLFQPTSKTC
jgi:hypothetical protein